MNKMNMKLILGLILVGGVISTGFMNAAPRKPKPIGDPCVLLKKACKDGGVDPNFITKDCVEHIIAGHDVPGVSTSGLSSGQLQSCKAYIEMQRGK